MITPPFFVENENHNKKKYNISTLIENKYNYEIFEKQKYNELINTIDYLINSVKTAKTLNYISLNLIIPYKNDQLKLKNESFNNLKVLNDILETYINDKQYLDKRATFNEIDAIRNSLGILLNTNTLTESIDNTYNLLENINKYTTTDIEEYHLNLKNKLNKWKKKHIYSYNERYHNLFILCNNIQLYINNIKLNNNN
jgi:hypothetical protein